MNKGLSIGLTALASAGVIFTAALTAVATTKAEKILAEKKPKTKAEKVKAVVPVYIPAVVTGAATIASIIALKAVTKKEAIALAAAGAAIGRQFNQYKGAVKDIFGEEGHQKVVDHVVEKANQEIIIRSYGILDSSTLDFGKPEVEVVHTFYDPFSERYFESTLDRVLQAEYHLNHNFIIGDGVTLSDFYEFLGLSPTEASKVIGWSQYYDQEIYWIDFDHHIQSTDDGDIYVIDYVFEPIPEEY